MPKVYRNRKIYVVSKSGHFCSYCMNDVYDNIFLTYINDQTPDLTLFKNSFNSINYVSSTKSCKIHSDKNREKYCLCSTFSKKKRWTDCLVCKTSNINSRAGKCFCDVCSFHVGHCICLKKY